MLECDEGFSDAEHVSKIIFDSSNQCFVVDVLCKEWKLEGDGELFRKRFDFERLRC